VENLWRDVRLGIRSLIRSPLPTLAAVLTLALCIGANTTIFTVIHAFYQGLPLDRPEGVTSVFHSSPVFGAWGRISYPDYLDYRKQNRVFEDLAAEGSLGASLTVDGETEWFWGTVVSGNYFSALGIQPELGRTFAPDEQVPGGPRVLLLSHALWQHRFHGDPGVVGRPVKINGHDFTVIGVIPDRFKGTVAFLHPALWIPIHHLGVASSPARLEQRPVRWLYVLGRLRDGVSLAEAQASFDVTAAGLEKAYPETEGNERKAALTPATWMPPAAREWHMPSVRLLMGAVLVLLLIACVNVSSLLLARTNARRIETGVQLALGAKRWRLVRQVFLESLLLALAGGVLGLPVALAASRTIAGYFAPPVPGAPGNAPIFAPDLRVHALTFGVCLLTALLSGLVPAWQLGRSHAAPALRERRNQDKPGPLRLTWGGSLVTLQIALSFALLICAGLIAHSVQSVVETDPGYPVKNVLLAQLDLPSAGYEAVDGKRFYLDLQQRLAALPGVLGASLAEVPPLAAYSRSDTIRLPETPDQEITVDVHVVGSGFFETLRMPLLRGRTLSPRDTAGTPGAAVVNESFVAKYIPKGEAVGHHITFAQVAEGEPGPGFEIVGVVKDTRYLTLSEPTLPLVFVPVQQRYRPRVVLVMRTQSDPRTLMEQTRKEIKALSSEVPVVFLTTLEVYMKGSIWEERMRSDVLQVFGLLALALAAVGVFGLTTHNVTRRWHEIGVRMALGANRRDVVLMMVRDALRLAVVGVVLGIPLSLWGQKLIAAFLTGIGTSSALTFVTMAALLGTIALLASWVPARRASRLDPLAAIKYD